MLKAIFTKTAHEDVRRKIEEEGGGTTTFRGEQRVEAGEGLDPLVDPSGGGKYGAVRRSLPRFAPDGKSFKLVMGPPMLIETLLDTTGSMGGNVKIAYDVLPTTYALLKGNLERYDLQMITAIFGDESDKFVLNRSQAEMAGKIAEQMTMMVPEKRGGDNDEDPDYGLFGAAYLTRSRLVEWGLKTYHFLLTDARGRGCITRANLTRVFGTEVFKEVSDNGHELPSRLPDTDTIVSDLLKISHAFVLLIGRSKTDYVYNFWSDMYGKNRVILLPSTELTPYVQAAVVGLTEGSQSLSNIEQYLKGMNLSEHDAKEVVRAVMHILIGAQTALPNFNHVPKINDVFRSKTDLWPIGHLFDPLKDQKGSEEVNPSGWL